MSPLALSGVSLKPDHYTHFLDNPKAIGWLEIHPENYMTEGGLDHQYLSEIRKHYPLSMHGVGMSLGTQDKLNTKHLTNLKQLVDCYQPCRVSEHLSWSHWQQNYFNDLLPLPYTKESLELICRNINQVQDFLQRPILIENPSTYIEFSENDFTEPAFLKEIIEKTGCKLLLDINNVYVTCFNHNQNTHDYIEQINPNHVEEIHLAGHTLMPLIDEKKVRVDDHGSMVDNAVWELYRYFLVRSEKSFPTLIEWDTNIPDVKTLLSEAAKATKIIQETCTQG